MTDGKHEMDTQLGNQKSKKSLLTKALFLALLLAVVITVFNQLSPSIDYKKPIDRKTYIELPDRKPLPIVTLEQAGKGQISTETMKGKWHMLLFGYTYCPDVCPVELSTLHKMMDNLRERIPANQLPQIVFISIDPERDAPTVIANYVKHFDPDFIGMTGKEIDLKVLTMPFGISWMKERNASSTIKTDDKNYLLSHSTTIILLNHEAKVAGLFPSPHSADAMAKAYQKIIKKEVY